MTEQTVSLTYRELADRLGISPDAARMKARRAVQKGRWRIIEGNHPNDPVRVELPAIDAGSPNATIGERRTRSTGERKGRTNTRTDAEAITGQMVTALQSAQERIRELTDLLTEEKDQHRQTAVELAQAEGVQANAVLEIDRLELTIAELQAELQAARRSWWQRMTGRQNDG